MSSKAFQLHPHSPALRCSTHTIACSLLFINSLLQPVSSFLVIFVCFFMSSKAFQLHPLTSSLQCHSHATPSSTTPLTKHPTSLIAIKSLAIRSFPCIPHYIPHACFTPHSPPPTTLRFTLATPHHPPPYSLTTAPSLPPYPPPLCFTLYSLSPSRLHLNDRDIDSRADTEEVCLPLHQNTTTCTMI